MRILRASGVAVMGLAFAACGGDVCDDVEDLLVDECGLPAADGDADSGEEVACEGEVEAAAQCAVDNSAAFCETITDPTNVGADNAYLECIGS